MDTPQKILDKIKKLKALIESAEKINSIQEAEAATLLMNNLLTKYNLSLMDIDDTDNSKPSIEIERSDLIPVQNPYGRLWKERLLMTLCMYNYCKVIGSSYKVFVLGCSIGLSVKLQEIRSQECTAVAIRHDELISDYIAVNLNLKSRTIKQPKTNESAYMKGFVDGKKTPLNKMLKQI